MRCWARADSGTQRVATAGNTRLQRSYDRLGELLRREPRQHLTLQRPCQRQKPSRPLRAQRATICSAAGNFVGIFSQLQGGATSILGFLESAPPLYYLVYMLAAGVGLPCSEDALVVWAGANIFKAKYGGMGGIAWVLAIIYVGVTVSDMITFAIGVGLRKGLFKRLKESLLGDSRRVDRAMAMVQRHSKTIGLVQRFTVGFRGPLCLISGFTGVSPRDFAVGVGLGAVGTMTLQVVAGYLLRNSPSPYLAALALVSGPNLIGNVLGPLLTAASLYFAGSGGDKPGAQQPPSVKPAEQ